MKKMLVVCWSWSNGNTAGIARRLAEAAGADLEMLETETPYPGDYQTTVDQGQKEVEQGFCPTLQPLKHDPDAYDVIAVGTPTWWYTMAPAVHSFFQQRSWKGRTVIPFMTNGGWPGHVIRDMSRAAAGAGILLPMEVQFDSEGGSHQLTSDQKVDAWIQEVCAALK